MKRLLFSLILLTGCTTERTSLVGEVGHFDGQTFLIDCSHLNESIEDIRTNCTVQLTNTTSITGEIIDGAEVAVYFAPTDAFTVIAEEIRVLE